REQKIRACESSPFPKGLLPQMADTAQPFQSEIAPVEDIQRAGQPAGSFEEDPSSESITQRDGIGRLEHANAVAQRQAVCQAAAGHNAGIGAAAFGIKLKVLNTELLRDVAGDRGTAHQAQPQRCLRQHVVVAAVSTQRTAQHQIGQRLLLAHCRLGEDIDTRLFGTAGDAYAGGDVIGLDTTNSLDIQERLAEYAGEQQLRTADGQALAVGPVTTIVEVELATGVEVVTDMQMPRQIGSEAETGEAQAVLADFDVDVHMHGQWRLRRFSFLADDLRVAAHRDRGWR